MGALLDSPIVLPSGGTVGIAGAAVGGVDAVAPAALSPLCPSQFPTASGSEGSSPDSPSRGRLPRAAGVAMVVGVSTSALFLLFLEEDMVGLHDALVQKNHGIGCALARMR